MPTADDRAGAVHWIDHVVVATNDVNRWVDWATNAIGVDARPVNALTTAARKRNRPIGAHLFIGDGSCHFGAFLQPEDLPPSRGTGQELPRYSFYVRPEHIDEHVARLEAQSVPHTAPVRCASEGDDGTAVYFEDPDQNQYELWAPSHMPYGAMEVSTRLNVGRISSAVYSSRDLRRTAEFFRTYCSLEPLDSSIVAEGLLVIPLVGGARLIYRLADRVDTRVTGHGPWITMHAALTVRAEDYMGNYRRLWAGVPEEESREGSHRTIEQEDELPARTGLHLNPQGNRWMEAYQRGDMFYDFDGHAFHFIGGLSAAADGSLALYRPKEQGSYLP